MPMARRFRHRYLSSSARRDADLRRAHALRYEEFAARYGALLDGRVAGAVSDRVALVSLGQYPETFYELSIVKALELAGYRAAVLIHGYPWLVDFFRLAGVEDAFNWRTFTTHGNESVAADIVASCHTLRDLMEVDHHGSRIGRHALSTALRSTKRGTFDLECELDRQVLTELVASSLSYADAASRVLDHVEPDLIVMIDKGYMPRAQLFDHAMQRGIETVSWANTHKSNAIMLSRSNAANSNQNNNTLSDASWDSARGRPLTAQERNELHDELYRGYAENQWFIVDGTQRNTRMLDADFVRSELGLDPAKKTAVVFSHITWHATLFWGNSLFETYEDWLAETVRAAIGNDKVNWVVKIHPAHIGKGLRERFYAEPAEAVALGELGELPAHITVLPADSDISTHSLFTAMDYCVTVRGTVGVESAVLGIPVLTAGDGPYSGRGFTIDSASQAEYLNRVSHIDAVPSPTEEQRALAEQFAYAYFISRTLELETITLEYHESLAPELADGRVNLRDGDDWRSAADIKTIADWLNDPTRVDLLT